MIRVRGTGSRRGVRRRTERFGPFRFHGARAHTRRAGFHSMSPATGWSARCPAARAALRGSAAAFASAPCLRPRHCDITRIIRGAATSRPFSFPPRDPDPFLSSGSPTLRCRRTRAAVRACDLPKESLPPRTSPHRAALLRSTGATEPDPGPPSPAPRPLPPPPASQPANASAGPASGGAGAAHTTVPLALPSRLRACQNALDRSAHASTAQLQHFLGRAGGRARTALAGWRRWRSPVDMDARSTIALEVYLRGPRHRAAWRGGADILVATARDDSRRRRVRYSRPPGVLDTAISLPRRRFWRVSGNRFSGDSIGLMLPEEVGGGGGVAAAGQRRRGAPHPPHRRSVH